MLESKRRKFVGTVALLSISVGLSIGVASEVKAEKVLNGAVCAQRVNELTNSINWYSSLDDAKQKAKREKKLILWVNMLGKLEGDT